MAHTVQHAMIGFHLHSLKSCIPRCTLWHYRCVEGKLPLHINVCNKYQGYWGFIFVADLLTWHKRNETEEWLSTFYKEPHISMTVLECQFTFLLVMKYFYQNTK